MIWALVFSLVAFAAEPKELWSLKIENGEPEAVFFDVASGAIYVSVSEEAERSRLDKVSLEGKLEARGFVKAKGTPGPVRAYGGKLYWVAGQKTVLVVNSEGGAKPLPGVPGPGRAHELALDKNGNVFLALTGEEKRFFKVSNGKAELIFREKHVLGSFTYLDRLFLNVDGKLVSVETKDMRAEPKLKAEGKLGDCFGLQRTSAGGWLCENEGAILLHGKPVITLKKDDHRHFAYVFRMDPAEDFVVVPFREEGMIRAYRFPGAENKKKSR